MVIDLKKMLESYYNKTLHKQSLFCPMCYHKGIVESENFECKECGYKKEFEEKELANLRESQSKNICSKCEDICVLQEDELRCISCNSLKETVTTANIGAGIEKPLGKEGKPMKDILYMGECKKCGGSLLYQEHEDSYLCIHCGTNYTKSKSSKGFKVKNESISVPAMPLYKREKPIEKVADSDQVIPLAQVDLEKEELEQMYSALTKEELYNKFKKIIIDYVQTASLETERREVPIWELREDLELKIFKDYLNEFLLKMKDERLLFLKSTKPIGKIDEFTRANSIWSEDGKRLYDAIKLTSKGKEIIEPEVAKEIIKDLEIEPENNIDTFRKDSVQVPEKIFELSEKDYEKTSEVIASYIGIKLFTQLNNSFYDIDVYLKEYPISLIDLMKDLDYLDEQKLRATLQRMVEAELIVIEDSLTWIGTKEYLILLAGLDKMEQEKEYIKGVEPTEEELETIEKEIEGYEALDQGQIQELSSSKPSTYGKVKQVFDDKYNYLLKTKVPPFTKTELFGASSYSDFWDVASNEELMAAFQRMEKENYVVILGDLEDEFKIKKVVEEETFEFQKEIYDKFKQEVLKEMKSVVDDSGFIDIWKLRRNLNYSKFIFDNYLFQMEKDNIIALVEHSNPKSIEYKEHEDESIRDSLRGLLFYAMLGKQESITFISEKSDSEEKNLRSIFFEKYWFLQSTDIAYSSGKIPIPNLFEAMKWDYPELTIKELHAFLEDLRSERVISLYFVNDPGIVYKPELGITIVDEKGAKIYYYVEVR